MVWDDSQSPVTVPPGDEAHVEASIDFAMRLGVGLHAFGAPAHRVEEALTHISRRLGLEGQFFSTPTSVMAAFSAPGRRSNRLVRVQKWGLDLGRLADLDAIAEDVSEGRLTPAQGLTGIEAVGASPPRYGRAWVMLCYGLSSAASARFFGGALQEIAVAGGIGLLLGVVAELTSRREESERVFEPVGAFLGTVMATLAGAGLGGVSVPIATIAGLITLFPGLTFTVAMTELATRNLASGTSRLAGALVVFLNLGFGVALGSRVGGALVTVAPAVDPQPLPGWTEGLALGVACLTFGVLLRVPRRDLPWVMAAGVLAYGGSRAGAVLLQPELGSFLGALAVGMASNLYARWLKRPAVVPLVPGIMLLVPGSLGFRSISSLLARDVLSGVELAFAMGLSGVSLVAGLLMANVLVSPRRSL